MTAPLQEIGIANDYQAGLYSAKNKHTGIHRPLCQSFGRADLDQYLTKAVCVMEIANSRLISGISHELKQILNHKTLINRKLKNRHQN
ncbi:hypothetical protein ACQ86K_12735 [Mucilaginibacter sp. P19]|uniref:hypothetical protein n=1 Tax=Mucilaginibacter sp. P19 TaxID=3423947 RepID=UPI003D67C838